MVAGSAHGAVPRGIQLLAQLDARPCATARISTRVDQAFGATIRGCAAPRRSGPDTWLNAEMIASYEQLHELGFGHSVETYRGRPTGGRPVRHSARTGILRRIDVQPASGMPPRWRWRGWSRSAARATSESSTVRWPATHLASLGCARGLAQPICRVIAPLRAAQPQRQRGPARPRKLH